MTQRRQSETKMHGKIIQRLKAVGFKLLFIPLMAGQGKISEKSTKVSAVSCILDWNRQKTFQLFSFPRAEHEHITHVQAAKFQRAIRLRHFSETEETKVSSCYECFFIFQNGSLSHILCFWLEVPFWSLEAFCKITSTRLVFSSNKTAFLDTILLKRSRPVLIAFTSLSEIEIYR